MPEWFQTKVKFLKQMDNGLIKRVAETYLVDATSFTEAEARILLEVQDDQREINMVSIAKSNIKEVVFYGDTELWHKAKVTYIVADEESEKEKKVTTYLLVNSENVMDAYERTQEHLKEMLVPFRVPKIEETNIIEVYPYEPGIRSGLRRATPEDYPDEVDAAENEVPEEEAFPKIQPAVHEAGDFTMPKEGLGEEE